MWIYDTSVEAWTCHKTGGQRPPQTWRSAAWHHEGNFYLFGGGDFNICNKLHRLDLSNYQWLKLKPGGRAPSERHRRILEIP